MSTIQIDSSKDILPLHQLRVHDGIFSNLLFVEWMLQGNERTKVRLIVCEGRKEGLWEATVFPIPINKYRQYEY